MQQQDLAETGNGDSVLDELVLSVAGDDQKQFSDMTDPNIVDTTHASASGVICGTVQPGQHFCD